MNIPAKNGAYNSSKTRVAPVFTRIQSNPNWLQRLLSLVEGPDGQLADVPTICGKVEKIRYDSNDGSLKEESLKPPLSLLKYLVENFPEARASSIKGDSQTAQKRRLLAQKDTETIHEALAALQQTSLPEKAWYLLEGPTFPDVYIETDELLIVIEGKRTEAETTKSTTWMPIRHQMLRHMDCAWERKGTRRLIGFFIVEGDKETGELNDKWRQECNSCLSAKALKGSLPPNRSDAEREAIAASYWGVTTWKAVCLEFGIKWEEIRDLTVTESGIVEIID